MGRIDTEAAAALERWREIVEGQDKTVRYTIGEALAWSQLEREIGADVWERARELYEESLRPPPEPEPEPVPLERVDTEEWAISQRIRYARERVKLSQVDLAKRTGLSSAHISRLEMGKGDPTVPTLRVLAKGLDVSIAWLVGEDVHTSEPSLGLPGPRMKLSRFKRTGESRHDSWWVTVPIAHARELAEGTEFDTVLFPDGSIHYNVVPERIEMQPPLVPPTKSRKKAAYVRRDQVGERNYHARLTEKNVVEIKALIGGGALSYSAIARQFGIGAGQISRIARGLQWAHVPGPQVEPISKRESAVRRWKEPSNA
jgi:transcriptional regulator with XRE-family HTH domain